MLISVRGDCEAVCGFKVILTPRLVYSQLKLRVLITALLPVPDFSYAIV